jgi:hypothetical protein
MRHAAAIAGLGAGAIGIYDDLIGGTHARGLRGHARALGRGEITTGAVKVLGLSAVGLAAARCAGARGRDALVGGALVAGAANLVNLFDLRPGRALKVGAVGAATGLGGPLAAPAAAAFGAAIAVLPDDLAERVMIGDAGAGALGAVVGLVLAQAPGRRRLVALMSVVALTAASELVSFTRVIDAVPILRALDDLGRLPSEAAVAQPVGVR